MTTTQTSSDGGNPQWIADPIDEAFLAGIELLEQAYLRARDVDAELWEFALEIDFLYQAGMTISDLRWLVAKGFVLHGQDMFHLWRRAPFVPSQRRAQFCRNELFLADRTRHLVCAEGS